MFVRLEPDEMDALRREIAEKARAANGYRRNDVLRKACMMIMTATSNRLKLTLPRLEALAELLEDARPGSALAVARWKIEEKRNKGWAKGMICALES